MTTRTMIYFLILGVFTHLSSYFWYQLWSVDIWLTIIGLNQSVFGTGIIAVCAVYATLKRREGFIRHFHVNEMVILGVGLLAMTTQYIMAGLAIIESSSHTLAYMAGYGMVSCFTAILAFLMFRIRKNDHG